VTPLIVILSACTAIILLWLGYIWPPFGQRVRRVSGPWLNNFDQTQCYQVVMRDGSTTIGVLSYASLAFVPSGSEAFGGLCLLGLGGLFGGAILADRIDRERHATKGITLLFRDPLPHDDLIAFLLQHDAMIAGKRQPFLARLASPTPIWIYRVDEPIPHITPAMITAHPDPMRASAFLQAQTLLSADIQANLYLTTTPCSGEASTTALQQLACAFHHRWACVSIDASFQVTAGTELCHSALDGAEDLAITP
jgi:hypothetical protein